MKNFIIILGICIFLTCLIFSENKKENYDEIKEAKILVNDYFVKAMGRHNEVTIENYFVNEFVYNPGIENDYTIIVSSNFKFVDGNLNKNNDLEIEYNFTQLAEYFVEGYPQEGKKRKWYIKTEIKSIPLIVTMKKEKGKWKIYEISNENLNFLNITLRDMEKSLISNKKRTFYGTEIEKKKQELEYEDRLKTYQKIYNTLLSLKKK